jgi:hypothetical protein
MRLPPLFVFVLPALAQTRPMAIPRPHGLTLEFFRAKGRDATPQYGIRSVTVPGCVKRWEKLHRRCGRWPRRGLFQAAVFQCHWRTSITARHSGLDVRRVFLPGGEPAETGGRATWRLRDSAARSASSPSTPSSWRPLSGGRLPVPLAHQHNGAAFGPGHPPRPSARRRAGGNRRARYVAAPRFSRAQRERPFHTIVLAASFRRPSSSATGAPA